MGAALGKPDPVDSDLDSRALRRTASELLEKHYIPPPPSPSSPAPFVAGVESPGNYTWPPKPPSGHDLFGRPSAADWWKENEAELHRRARQLPQ